MHSVGVLGFELGFLSSIHQYTAGSFIVFGKLDDIPSNPLCDGPRIDDVMVVDKKNPHHLVEVVLADLDLILQVGEGSL